MADTQTAEERCATCGAEIAPDAGGCASCGAHGLTSEERLVCETVVQAECATEPECARAAIWPRVAAVVIYAAVCAACVYGSISFFESPVSSWTDWIFGAMALGLAFIAVIGIKESIFPSDWTPE